MTIFFDQYIREDIDALGMDGVAAIDGANVVAEYAGMNARDSAISLLGGRQVDRVEFIHRPGDQGRREYRGAVFYDTSSPRPRPYLHVLNALLGYDGSGPQLSRAIMTHLGMSEPMFARMNDSIRGIRSTSQPYVILAVNVGTDWLHDIAQPSVRNERRI